MSEMTKPQLNRWSAVVCVLVVAAAAFYFVNKNRHDPDMISGTGAITMKLRWESTDPRRLRVISPVSGMFSLYAGKDVGQPHRLTVPQSIDIERAVALDETLLQGAERICVIAAGDAQELQNLEDLMHLIWPRLEADFCVRLP